MGEITGGAYTKEYAMDRKIRPSVVDFYFLIDEGQMGARKFVTEDFYEKENFK